LKYQLFLFDFDYTLVDASGCLFAAIRAGLESIGIASVDDSKLKPLIGIPLQEQFRILTGTANQSLFETYYKAYVSKRRIKETSGTVLIPGVDTALAVLKRARFGLGVVSTGSSRRITRTFARLGLAQIFNESAIFGDYQEKSIGIQKARSEFGVSGNRTAYLGDRPGDGDAARDAGVGFIAVTTGAFAKRQFSPEVAVLDSVAQLPSYLDIIESSSSHFEPRC
jgi:phosphoglycolate phosphatase